MERTVIETPRVAPAGQAEQPERRRLLAAAATLGVAPWLLSACAAAASAPGGASSTPTSGAVSAARRRLGPLEVYPIGLVADPGAPPIVPIITSSITRSPSSMAASGFVNLAKKMSLAASPAYHMALS